MYEDEAPEKVHLERGFPIGFSGTPPNSETRNHYIFNHIQFILSYHQEPPLHTAMVGEEGPGGAMVPGAGDGGEAAEITEVDPKNVEEAKAAHAIYRIVGFEVEPFTGAHPHSLTHVRTLTHSRMCAPSLTHACMCARHRRGGPACRPLHVARSQ